MISMAVALSPAFAQQAQPQTPAGTPSSQPKSDMKSPAANQEGKETNLPAKPGDKQGRQPDSAKAGLDAKSTPPDISSKPGGVKVEKPASTKTETDVKNKGTTGKPAPDVKAGSTSKPAGAASEMKGTGVKPGANLKTDRPVKSTSASTLRKHHVKKSSGKTASRLRSKTRTSNLDSHGKGTKSESSAPLTGK